jgi:gliding motility-associated-like protein
MFDGQTTYWDTTYYRQVHWRSKGMAYLIVWNPWNWRTYIEVPLLDTLEAGQCYYAEFWVLTHEVSYKVIDALGLYFSDTLVKINNDTIVGGDTVYPVKPIYVQPRFENPAGRILKDTARWMKVSGTFTANGTETDMLMGCLKYSDQIQWEILNNYTWQSSRYYFDDFLVCKCEDTIAPAVPAPKVYLPNIFSPNGDGNNDVYYVRGTDVPMMNMKIFNRWGNLVFESGESQIGWDGSYQGKECPEGVYFYFLEFSGQDGHSHQKKGNVTLVR